MCKYRVRQRIGRFLSFKKIKSIEYSYIYKEVHTLEFAEISESLILKHNTEQNTIHHSTRYIRKMPSITLFTLSKPIVNTTHGPT